MDMQEEEEQEREGEQQQQRTRILSTSRLSGGGINNGTSRRPDYSNVDFDYPEHLLLYLLAVDSRLSDQLALGLFFGLSAVCERFSQRRHRLSLNSATAPRVHSIEQTTNRAPAATRLVGTLYQELYQSAPALRWLFKKSPQQIIDLGKHNTCILFEFLEQIRRVHAQRRLTYADVLDEKRERRSPLFQDSSKTLHHYTGLSVETGLVRRRRRQPQKAATQEPYHFFRWVNFDYSTLFAEESRSTPLPLYFSENSKQRQPLYAGDIFPLWRSELMPTSSSGIGKHISSSASSSAGNNDLSPLSGCSPLLVPLLVLHPCESVNLN
jgi:hypothetical protein